MRQEQKYINVCSDPILKGYLQQQGVSAEVFDVILNSEEKVRMLETLTDFASNWFLTNEGFDYSEYRNVSIGASIHDEMRTYFHLLIHFIYVVSKIGKDTKITFFHSTSCLMPDVIIDFLTFCGACVKLIDAKYPWLSFKEQHESQIKSNFSRINFGRQNRKSINLKEALSQIKLSLKVMLSKVLFKIFAENKKYCIYLHAFRSLMPLYCEHIKNKKERSYNLFITDTTALEPSADNKSGGFWRDIARIFFLARKGIALNSLKCPFYYKWYINFKNKKGYQRLVCDFDTYFLNNDLHSFTGQDEKLPKFFLECFKLFYREHLEPIMKLIDFYYENFGKIKIDLCLHEMCHPFEAQVLANLKIPVRIFPSNHIINNQYFAPCFLKKTKNYFKPITFSDLGAERFVRLGFVRENVRWLPFSVMNFYQKKILPPHYIDTVAGKKILILAPSIIATDTFRYCVQSERLFCFFNEVFEILSDCRVSSVTIRPHPGANVSRNQFGFTDNDILKYLVDKVPSNKKTFRIIFSDSYFNNLESNILKNDLIIANISGALFETLMFGRDYIYFDDTITPYYGAKDWTLFNEGTIKRLKTKNELQNHLSNYAPPDIELLQNKLFANKSFLNLNNNAPTSDDLFAFL